MAAYETSTRLNMTESVARAREFFELKHGLRVRERLGAVIRWQGVEKDMIELRAFPVRGGGTRLELETLHSDALVMLFIRELPRPSLLDEFRQRLRKS